MLSTKLKHWRLAGIVAAALMASGCYATASGGRSVSLLPTYAEANGR